jgi:hypothetical protein
MAKKKVTKKKFKAPKRIRKTEEDRLMDLINASERAITTQGTVIDDIFKNQAARLRKELEELRLKNELRDQLS